MHNIEQYLITELNKEKEKLKREFEQKETELKRLLEEKILREKEKCARMFSLKKEAIIKNAREIAEQKFYRAINKKIADLSKSFSNEAIKLLRNADKSIQDKILSFLIASFKKKTALKSNGIFIAPPETTQRLKESFPQANIKVNKNIAFGFKYVDDRIEVDSTDESIIKKYEELAEQASN